MEWLGMLLISPVWGYLSTRCFIQASLGVAQLFIHLVGFFRGVVLRNDNALYMGIALFNVLFFSLLLVGGFWLLTVILPFGQTQIEIAVYWISAGISFLFFSRQVPAKIRGTWRYATIPNALWVDSMKQKLGD
jgi:hypothetical protein